MTDHITHAAGAAQLVTIPDVEIATVGDWNTMKGNGTFTIDDLVACVAAQDDAGFSTPRLKIGHTDARFDGEPCFGSITNLRMSSDMMTLLGDIEAVPAWLADMLPSAYPTRSIEMMRNATSYTTGRKYAGVMTGLALLGAFDPAISTLADLKATIAPDDVADVEGVAARFANIVQNGGEGESMPTQEVSASVNVEDVRRAFYDEHEAMHPYWWMRSMMLDPNELIIDDDQGHLYRVPFDVSGDAISFGEPTEVMVEFVDVASAPAEPVAARRMPVVTFASRSDSHRSVTNETEGTKMDTNAIITNLGLADDATEADVLARITELTAAAEGDATGDPTLELVSDEDAAGASVDNGDAATVSVPEGAVLIDAGQLAELQANAEMGVAARTAQIEEARTRFIGDAVQAGRIPPARADFWREMHVHDPEGTEATIAAFPEGMATPVGVAAGRADNEKLDDSYPTGFAGLGTIRNRQEG